MTIAAGTIQYQLGTAPVTGCGFSYSADDLKKQSQVLSYLMVEVRL